MNEVRPSIKAYLLKYPTKKINAAEIGVGAGANAKSILDNMNINRLTLVDSWHSHYNPNINEWLVKTKERFEDDPKVGIIIINSTYSDYYLNQMDYIYIDGGHSYEQCKKDIEIAWKKVVKGGMLAGHDYIETSPERVYRAVHEFADRYKLEVYNKGLDWWIWK